MDGASARLCCQNFAACRGPRTKKSVPDEPARHEACKGICSPPNSDDAGFAPWELRERGDACSTPQTMHEVIIHLNEINVSQFSPNYDRVLFFDHQSKSAGKPHITGRYEAKSA